LRLLVVAVASVILFFPTYWLFHAVVGPDWGAGIAAVAMYVVFPVIALRAWGGKSSSQPPSMERALEAGELAQIVYEVGEAVAVREAEDEGLHYYLAIASDKTLFLSGQYLYEQSENGSFPSTRIRLFWHKTLGFTYGVECLGEPLKPSRQLPPFTIEQMRAADAPEDRQLFNLPISSFVASAA
jgi:hypothetical protein